MISNMNKRLNDFLKNEKISKENFDDLKNIANITNFDEKIMTWFRYLQTIEVVGWRNKLVTKKICDILAKNQPLQFYSLFCPSYIKGKGEAGFRIDDVGNTTKNGLKRLDEITKMTRKLGFKCNDPEAIFFDLSLEQPTKTIHMLNDLKANISNFCNYLPKGMKFSLLSEKFPELMDIIGYTGIVVDPLPVDEVILNRIVDRGKKFYELFGWSMEQIISRSRVIASGEAIVGTFLRYNLTDGIMVYTPTMLERAEIYSGKHQDDPLAIIIPKKDYMGS